MELNKNIKVKRDEIMKETGKAPWENNDEDALKEE